MVLYDCEIIELLRFNHKKILNEELNGSQKGAEKRSQKKTGLERCERIAGRRAA